MFSSLDQTFIDGGAAARWVWWKLTGIGGVTGVAVALACTGVVVGTVAAHAGVARAAGLGQLFGVDPVDAHLAAVGFEAAWLMVAGAFVVHVAYAADHHGAGRAGDGGTVAADIYTVLRRIIRMMFGLLVILRLATAGHTGVAPALLAGLAIVLFAFALGAVDADPPSGRTVWEALRDRLVQLVPVGT